MDMHHPFLEWRQYYGAAPGEIESGDLPLRTLIAPVLQTLRERRLFGRCELMRYSLQGYHWRVKLRVAPGGDLDALQGALAEALTTRASTGTPDDALPLGDYALRLHERTGQAAEMRPAGHRELLRRQDDASLFEDAAVYDDWTSWADASSTLLMRVKALRPSARMERQFWRLYLFEVLRGCGLRPVELHYASCFIERQWSRFFDVESDTLTQCRATADALAPRLLEFLMTSGGVAGTAASLPGPLAALFEAAVNADRERLAGQMRRDAGGHLGNPSALRLGAVIHLVHNRAGLGIDQELLFCRLGQHVWRSQLEADAVLNNERWAARNLDAYFDNPSIVI